MEINLSTLCSFPFDWDANSIGKADQSNIFLQRKGHSNMGNKVVNKTFNSFVIQM